MLAVRADVTAQPFEAQPTAPDRKGPVDCWPQPPATTGPRPSVAPLDWPRTGGFHLPHLAAGLARRVTFPLRRRARPPCRQRRRASYQGCRLGRTGLVGRHPARLLAAGCWSNDLKKPKVPPTTGCPTCRPTLRSPTWSVWPGSDGASSTTTENSSTAWAWTTSKAGASPAGTTTSPS